MEHSDDYYLSGSDSHEGRCPMCEEPNGDCTDGLCETCYELQPVKCQDCGDMVQPDQMEGSICRNCYDGHADMICEGVESVWSEIH